jgi:hypothetical protein
MRSLFAAVVSAALCASASSALAYLSTDLRSHMLEPRWNAQGSAVCPESYDYVRNVRACRLRGEDSYARMLDGEPASVKPGWSRSGSAVCPANYDYRARPGRNSRTGLCHRRPD